MATEIPHAQTRVNVAVEQRLRNIARRLITARQAVVNLRADGENDLADLMQATIDHLNMEEIAWRQWQLEGFKAPTLAALTKQRGEQDARSERQHVQPPPEPVQ